MPVAAPRRIVSVLVVALLALGAGGCSQGGDGEGDSSADGSADVDELAPVPDPLESLAEPPPGQGVAVIGFEELSFTVTDCIDGPTADDTPEATLDYSVDGRGETSDGAFSVLITRYRSDTGVGDAVYTETVRIVFGTDDDQRGIEAKRTTAGVGGAWLDLLDPDADAPLIERHGDAYDVRSSFGPIASVAGADGVEVGRLRARCPA